MDVDVVAFDAAIKSAKRTDLEQAVALYCGPLLEGCTEEWVFQERNVRDHNWGRSRWIRGIKRWRTPG